MSGGDSSDLEIFGSVSCQFKNFGSQVFKDSSTVDGSSGSDSVSGRDSALEESVNSTNGELRG